MSQLLVLRLVLRNQLITTGTLVLMDPLSLPPTSTEESPSQTTGSEESTPSTEESTTGTTSIEESTISTTSGTDEYNYYYWDLVLRNPLSLLLVLRNQPLVVVLVNSLKLQALMSQLLVLRLVLRNPLSLLAPLVLMNLPLVVVLFNRQKLQVLMSQLLALRNQPSLLHLVLHLSWWIYYWD